MKLTVLKIQKKKSKYGGVFYYVFMKSDLGQSFKSCVSPAYGNWKRCSWNKVIAQGAGSILEYRNFPINMKGLLDADISFTLLPKQEPENQEDNNEIKEQISY